MCLFSRVPPRASGDDDNLIHAHLLGFNSDLHKGNEENAFVNQNKKIKDQ